MDCPEAREHILESLAEPRPGAKAGNLENHLADCEACRRFWETQLKLDLQLSATISAPALSPEFRKSLMKKLHRQPFFVWPELLPDAAHLAGCMFAIALCVPILPFRAGPIVLAGLAFTLTTYFAQSVIRGSWETWEEDQQ
jgi:predicted anti-sigma-YlaC factor YlaD